MSIKPLGGKSYGSIPHLPLSRLGPGDHRCTDGEARACLVRDHADRRVLVTEKLDGACVSIAKINGLIVPLVRAGYRAETARYGHLRMFGVWVMRQSSRFDAGLADGQRICGEWLLQAHGTRYDSHGREPFVAFDLIRQPKPVQRGTVTMLDRAPYDEFRRAADKMGLQRAHVISDGPPCSIETALDILTRDGRNGFHGALDPVEGCVWRVEGQQGVDFMAKWVSAGKQDGAFLPEISGRPPIWNWDPTHERLNHAETSQGRAVANAAG
jgi:hypothetical protein